MQVLGWQWWPRAGDDERCPYHRGLLRLPSKPKVVEFVLELELLELAALTISYEDLTISME